MEILDRLLNNLTQVWNIQAKDVQALTIRQGSGQYHMVSIDATQLYFHAESYKENMPMAQTIALDGYTLKELADTINSMGYIATLTSEDKLNDNDYTLRKASTLMTAYNVSLSSPATFSVFTAPTWKLLYPIARAIYEWTTNMNSAIPQMVANLATDKWADYWATFFTIQRNSGEDDSNLRTRIFMNLANLKTNNVALAELVAFAIKGKVTVQDVSPGIFEITIDSSYINTVADVHSIINGAKAGGVSYILNYTGMSNFEDFKAYFKTVTGLDFASSDTMMSTTSTTTRTEPESYGMTQINNSMTLGRDTIGVAGAVMQLIPNPRLISDTATMTFTLNGSVVQTGAV